MEKHGEANPFYTTSDFWDCDCVLGNYIHSALVDKCFKCGALRENSPDARIDEIEASLNA